MQDGSDILTFLVIAAAIGLVPALIARSRGHSFFGWWFFGAALFIVALPASLFLKRDRAALDARRAAAEGLKKCPSCAEMIREEATVCRFCQAPQAEVVAPPPQPRACPYCRTTLLQTARKCPDCRRALPA